MLCAAILGCSGSRDQLDANAEKRIEQRRPDYLVVARGLRSTLGLADARGLAMDDAAAFVRELAPRFDRCVAEQHVAEGAARVIAYVDAAGSVGPPKIETSGGDAALAVILLCLVAPLRTHAFTPAASRDSRAPGFAIEAIWDASR